MSQREICNHKDKLPFLRVAIDIKRKMHENKFHKSEKNNAVSLIYFVPQFILDMK